MNISDDIAEGMSHLLI